MAKPELEDGYTQIANEILEKLVRMHLAPNQWQVLICIIRKTYGFHKKVDYIANFQIGEATGLCKAVVSRCLKELNDRQLITRKGKHIGFQKDWEKWQGLAFQTTLGSELAEPSTLLDNKSKQNSQPELAVPSTELAELSTKVSSCAVTQKIKDTLPKKLYKRKYGEFKNVLLTDEEYQKLEDRFGDSLGDKMESLSIGIESKGYRYKSHYATVLAWDKRDRKGGQGGAHRGGPRQLIPRDSYTKPEDL